MLQPCSLCRADIDAGALLRFAVAPDGVLTPDLAEKLPGEALHVPARRGCLVRLAAAHGCDAAALAGQVEALVQQRLLQGLGLARKAGVLVLGFAKVEAALEAGRLALLLAAEDGAVHGRQALARKAAALGVAVESPLRAEQLGMALGRANVIHAGLADAGWAARIGKQIALLAALRDGADCAGRSEDE